MTEQQTFHNVVSFSITDNDENKILGAIENAKILSTVFPEWRGHFYVDSSIEDEVKETISAQENCFVYAIEQENEQGKPVWGFYPLGHTDTVSAMIVRPCDSLLCERDFQAVSHWIESPIQFHTIRDCEQDRGSPVNPRLFGAKLHGPVNTIWLLHFLHNVNQQGIIDLKDLLTRFYGGFSFLFMEHDDEKRFNGIKFPEEAAIDGPFVGMKYDFEPASND